MGTRIEVISGDPRLGNSVITTMTETVTARRGSSCTYPGQYTSWAVGGRSPHLGLGGLTVPLSSRCRSCFCPPLASLALDHFCAVPFSVARRCVLGCDGS